MAVRLMPKSNERTRGPIERTRRKCGKVLEVAPESEGEKGKGTGEKRDLTASSVISVLQVCFTSKESG